MSDVSLWLKHPWAFSEGEAKAMKDQMLRLLDEKDAEIERLRAEHDDYVVRATAEVTRLRAELAAERERCAKVADKYNFGPSTVGAVIAAAIRKGEP